MTTAVRDSVQHGTALRNNEKTKSCESMINLSQWHSQYFVPGSRNFDGS